MNNRTKRFNVGDRVIDRNGQVGVVLEAHCDPHPRDFMHCSGSSARYLIQPENHPTPVTRWDWQLSSALQGVVERWAREAPLTPQEAADLVNDFKQAYPQMAKFFHQCSTSNPSASTKPETTPAA
jgi:hypothetical protein